MRYFDLLSNFDFVHILQLHFIVFVLIMHLINQYYDNISAWFLTLQ